MWTGGIMVGYFWIGCFLMTAAHYGACILILISTQKANDQLPFHALFFADPRHRIKVMCGAIFNLAKETKDPNACKKVDALRIKRYIGCFVLKINTYHCQNLWRNHNPQSRIYSMCTTGAIQNGVTLSIWPKMHPAINKAEGIQQMTIYKAVCKQRYWYVE